MSLESEKRRVEYGGEIAGYRNTGESCMQRLDTLKTQIGDLRQRITADPDMGQTELDEVDVMSGALIAVVQVFAAQFSD